MDDGIADIWRRLTAALGRLLFGPDPTVPAPDDPDAAPLAVERPWRHRWDHLPKRSAGFGFPQHDYRAARRRAEEVARLTLVDALWARVRCVGYLDLPSQRFPVAPPVRNGSRSAARSGGGR